MSSIDYGNLVCEKLKFSDDDLDIVLKSVEHCNLNTVVVTFVVVYRNN